MMIPKTLLQLFEQSGSALKIKRKEALYRQSFQAEYLYFLKSGLFGLVTSGATGKEHLVRLFKAGQVMGHRALISNDSYHASAMAIEDSEVVKISGALFVEELKKNSDMAFYFLQIMGQDLARAETRIGETSELSVTLRVAEALLYLFENYPEHLWTRQEIAEFIGSSTPTVFRVMAEFEEKNWIKTQRRKISIVDRDSLLSLSAT